LTPHRSALDEDDSPSSSGMQVTRRRSKSDQLIDANVEIASPMRTEENKERLYWHAIFCQLGLPRSRIGGRSFKRQSGDAWLKLSAGSLDEGNGEQEQIVPYGAFPRLAIAYATSFAVLNNTPEIPLGTTFREFLGILGLDDSGPRYDRAREQMHAVAALTLEYGLPGRTFRGVLVKQMDALPRKHSSLSWPGVAVLSDDFYHALRDRSAVPLDHYAVHKLRGSAMQLDVYAWLANRLHRIHTRHIELTWGICMEQFGQEYSGKDPVGNFRREFWAAIVAVKMVYPEANVDKVRGGIVLKPSPPPIALRLK